MFVVAMIVLRLLVPLCERLKVQNENGIRSTSVQVRCPFIGYNVSLKPYYWMLSYETNYSMCFSELSEVTAEIVGDNLIEGVTKELRGVQDASDTTSHQPPAPDPTL